MSPAAKGLDRPRSPGWIVGPLMLLAAACGILLVTRGPDGLFVVGLGSILALTILWIFVSALWPARADRTCPACGRETLRRADPETTRGVACGACGHADPEESSFLIAEEESPIEPAVLRERELSRSLR